MPSSIPFEQRYRPPDPKRRKRERLTKVDRLVCAVTGAFLGFVILAFGFLILLPALMRAAARQPAAVPPIKLLDGLLAPFSWGGLVVAGFAVFGAVVGPERMLDAFEWVIRVEAKFAEHINRS
jgi:hypothetical protein